MYQHRTFYSLTTIILFIIVFMVSSYHGYSNRIVASEKTVLTVDTPEQAYSIWKGQRVKGRILLLFDKYPHMGGFASYHGNPQLTRSNLVEYSIFNNIIRKIYFIIPDNDWEEFRQQEALHPLRKVAGIERGLFLYNLSGIPIIATTPSSLPELSEEPLVYINTQVFDSEQTLEVLSQKKIASDIIISCQVRNR